MSSPFTLIGLAAALIGVTLTWYFGKKGLKLRRRTNLTFYEESCIALFEAIVESIEGIEITYEKEKIEPNLVLLKACVANTGDTDIDNASVHKPLSLSLPKDFKWLKANIVSSSPDVNATWQLPRQNDLIFVWDLLKPNEYFRFDALAETPAAKEDSAQPTRPVKALRENLDLNVRITDLGCVHVGRLGSLIRFDWWEHFSAIAWVALGILSIVIAFARFASNEVVHYELKLHDGTKVEVTLEPAGQGQVMLKGVDDDFIEKGEAQKLFALYQTTPLVVVDRRLFYSGLGFGVLCILVGSWFIVGYLRAAKRQRRRLRMFDLLK